MRGLWRVEEPRNCVIIVDPLSNCWEQVFGYVPGWWFGTCFIFHNIWDVILPIDFNFFQDGYCTTNQFWLCPKDMEYDMKPLPYCMVFLRLSQVHVHRAVNLPKRDLSGSRVAQMKRSILSLWFCLFCKSRKFSVFDRSDRYCKSWCLLWNITMLIGKSMMLIIYLHGQLFIAVVRNQRVEDRERSSKNIRCGE